MLILRVAIQIISAGGLFLVGLVILGNAPRIASITTHDVLNRISTNGRASYTSMKYDVGLVSLHPCTTAGDNIRDNPASVSNDDTARALVDNNILNGTDATTVKYFQCEAAHTIQLNANDTLDMCTQWINSTYADKSAFSGLNRSDTAVLMPRQLGRYHHAREDVFDLNGYYYGPLFTRALKPTIMNGIVVVLHDTGLRAFIGVPNLQPNTRVSLPQTLAIESDIGCMTVGIYTQRISNNYMSSDLDLFQTNESRPFKQYVGPDYLEVEVSRTVGEVREYLKPMWNMSTLTDDGLVFGINDSETETTSAANVRSYFLPNRPTDQYTANVDAHRALFGNHQRSAQDENSCGFLGFGGSIVSEGDLAAGVSKVVCATATQVNLVDADVEVDGNGNVTVTFQRVPSDLNAVVADYWDIMQEGEDTRFNTWDTVYRYTLSSNPNGPTQHFVRPRNARIQYTMGAGSGGRPIPRLGGIMLNTGGTLDLDDQFLGLSFLEDEYSVVDYKSDPARAAKWACRMGGSFLLGSAAFNGWAANAMADGPLMAISTGGKQATCYRIPYAIAFVPLLFAALLFS